jgi:Uma2 family endonuclease
MSVAVSLPPSGPPLPSILLRRFTVEEYHRMIRAGILTEDEPVELLDGWIVIKMPRNPQHDITLEKSDSAIRKRIPPGWRIRIQCAVTLDDSEPEPDLALVRGSIPSHATSHPRPSELGMLFEVSDTSLDYDRSVKSAAYARAAIPVYWIINLVERQIEVYTDPTGSGPQSVYRRRRDFKESALVPLELEGREIATIAVRDLLP